MKKKVIILLSVLLLTGCTAVRINTKDIANTVNIILSKNNKTYNRVGKGYKYYVPRGLTYIDTNELNEKLYSNGNYYYLYIDAVSYYYKNKPKYKENKDAYYSKVFKVDNKQAYLEINKVDKKYLIKFEYNYARIESLVEKKDIEEVVMNSSYILSTVKFNNNVIKLMLDENYFTNKNKKYNVFEKKNENKNSKFLKYNKKSSKKVKKD
jgi:hypothetical protein